MNIDEYKGLRIIDKLKTDAQKGVYMANWNQLRINYGNNVEWQKLKNQVLMCSETRNMIYAVPADVKYVQGSRPVIEMTSQWVTKDAKTARERVLALLKFCRDLYLTHGKHLHYRFYGGTEEQLIEKGENLCECMGRLMVSLCEVLGIPGRIVMHVVNGHITSEVFIENKWCFFDPRFAVFYVDENEAFLSVEEIMQNREIIFNQPQWVKEFVSKQTDFDTMARENYDKYMCSKEIITFCDYSLMDFESYTYETKLRDEIYQDGMKPAIREYQKYMKLVMNEEKGEI